MILRILSYTLTLPELHHVSPRLCGSRSVDSYYRSIGLYWEDHCQEGKETQLEEQATSGGYSTSQHLRLRYLNMSRE